MMIDFSNLIAYVGMGLFVAFVLLVVIGYSWAIIKYHKQERKDD